MNEPSRHFGCNTYSYTMTHKADACLSHLIDLGFSQFELMMYPGHLWPAETNQQQRSALRQLIDTHHLQLVSLNMPNIDINIAAAASEMRDYSLALLRQVIQLAGDLGAAGVVLAPGKSNPLFAAPRDELDGHFFKALDQLAPLAHKAGTALWLENMPFAYIPDIKGLMQALKRYGNDKIGIVYDVANGHFISEDLGDALRQCRQRLKLVHLSDTTRKLYRHDPVGAGDVPFQAVPQVLTEIGYSRLPMFEIISQNADADILTSAATLARLGF